MSATWVRAQALGQPLTLTVIWVSRSGKRFSSSATRARERSLVSTIASLQNSMPVQAIVERRQLLGRAVRPIFVEVVGEGGVVLGGDVEHHQLLVRRQAGAASAVLLDEVSEPRSACVPSMRPTIGATPT